MENLMNPESNAFAQREFNLASSSSKHIRQIQREIPQANIVYDPRYYSILVY